MQIPYDLVVSAFSLMELPSATARLETVDKLWNKTQEYLVLVESGTKAGFTVPAGHLNGVVCFVD